MAACPELWLRKSELGWDPYSETRSNILLQHIQKNLSNFKLLEHIKAAPSPLTLEEVKALAVDFDEDMHKDWGEAPEDYPCPNDNLPIIIAIPQSACAPDSSPGHEISNPSAEDSALANETLVVGQENPTSNSPKNSLEQAS